MQKSTQQSLQDLNRRLGPHSPTGSIPGLPNQMAGNPFDDMVLGAPGEYDPNTFINFDDPEDFDFGFDTTGNDAGNNSNWPNFGGDGQVDDNDDALFGEQ